MSEVYLARHRLIGKDFALKVLRPELAEIEEWNARFHREAMAAAAIEHPNIVDITDYGFLDSGSAFIVMEHLQGESLREILAREGALPAGRCVEIARQILSALAAAHARGVIHRDLKADNVVVVERHGEPQVKLLDFGISKILQPLGDRERLVTLTGSGVVMGTPQYISPEAIQGETTDGRSDLYSLGVILYEMLTGRLPFEATSVVDLLFKQVRERPDRPSQVRPDLMIAAEIESVVLRALEKLPEERFASAGAMLEALPDSLRGPTLPLPRASRRSGLWLSVLAALGLTGVIVAVLLSRFMPSRHAAPPADAAPAAAVAPARAPDLSRVADARITVRIRIETVPVTARVFLGDQLLGTGKVVRDLPQGAEARELRVIARGHRSQTLQLIPDRDRTVKVKLERGPRRQGPARGPVDLHKNPYRNK
jgi:serine/threonine-protein kinase